MAPRPFHVRVAWTLRDYAKRVWDNSGEDNIFFLAGGIAFNLLLAAVPFVLLLVAGLGEILRQAPADAVHVVAENMNRLLPPGVSPGQGDLEGLLRGIVESRGPVGLYSAILFVWFSTRLFGSLRSVLAEVFDIETDRGIVAGKIFDVKVTVLSTVLFVAYTVVNTYVELGRSRGIALLGGLGLRRDVMGWLQYATGRVLAFGFIVLLFYALYKVLPHRRMRWQTALLAAVFAGGLFEAARSVFTVYATRATPDSVYTGALAALVVFVIWVYYAAMLFILGGEVAQVYELRRVRRQQREVFE
jgi:membrane protein